MKNIWENQGKVGTMMNIIKMILSAIFFFSITLAAPFWDFSQMQAFEESYARYRTSKTGEKFVPEIRTSYPADMANACQFVADWQLYDTDSAEHGGIIEAETGELRSVIQTDNTQESVIIWSIYKTLFRSDIYDSNTSLSLGYVRRFPAYNEETDEYSFYYPVWNCGLALLMVIEYTNATSDSSLLAYGDSCAEFLIDSILPLDTPWRLYNLLHCYVTAFSAGCLMIYGDYRDNSDYMTNAEFLGARAKDWASAHPDTAYGAQIWAMSSGTLVWGLLNSYFVRHPAEIEEWLEEYVRPRLPEIVPPPHVFDPYIWDNSWNIWYANGYRALVRFAPDTIWWRRFVSLVDYLIIQDTDDDGGIPSSAVHGDTMDMSWVTTYLVFMGIDGIWDSLSDVDAGAMELGIYGE